VPRELTQQDAAQPTLVLTVGATHRDDDAPRAVRGQLVDQLHQVKAEPILVGVQIDDRRPRADQVIEKTGLALGRAHLFGNRRVVGYQTDPRALALHQGIGALRRGVPDVLCAVQQRFQVRFAEDARRGLGHAVEKTLGQVERGGQGLGVGEVRPVPDTDVGKRPTVIDVDQTFHEVPLRSEMR
jgi:hypothetical protein